METPLPSSVGGAQTLTGSHLWESRLKILGQWRQLHIILIYALDRPGWPILRRFTPEEVAYGVEWTPKWVWMRWKLEISLSLLGKESQLWSPSPVTILTELYPAHFLLPATNLKIAGFAKELLSTWLSCALGRKEFGRHELYNAWAQILRRTARGFRRIDCRCSATRKQLY